jgi:hypothetical protein
MLAFLLASAGDESRTLGEILTELFDVGAPTAGFLVLLYFLIRIYNEHEGAKKGK